MGGVAIYFTPDVAPEQAWDGRRYEWVDVVPDHDESTQPVSHTLTLNAQEGRGMNWSPR